MHPVLETVRQGVELLQGTHKGGDPTLKLEKFVLEWVSGNTQSELMSGRDEASETLGAGPRVGSETHKSKGDLVSDDFN